MVVEGRISDAQRTAIIALKSQLLALLAAEGMATVETVNDHMIAPEISPPAPESALPPEPAAPPPPLLPRGYVVAGVPIMTAEMFRWRALRDDAACRGVKSMCRPRDFAIRSWNVKRVRLAPG